jgi:hypothetical protein
MHSGTHACIWDREQQARQNKLHGPVVQTVGTNAMFGLASIIVLFTTVWHILVVAAQQQSSAAAADSVVGVAAMGPVAFLRPVTACSLCIPVIAELSD